jgi:hypothetical protein
MSESSTRVLWPSGERIASDDATRLRDWTLPIPSLIGRISLNHLNAHYISALELAIQPPQVLA